jgi:hypothetical protein
VPGISCANELGVAWWWQLEHQLAIQAVKLLPKHAAGPFDSNDLQLPAISTARDMPDVAVCVHLLGVSCQWVCRASNDSSAISINVGDPMAVLPTPSAASAATAAEPVAAAGPAWQPQDIIKATTADGADICMEVISTPSSSVSNTPAAAAAAPDPQEQQQQQHPVVAHQGVLYAVQQTQQQLLLLPQGWQLQPDHQLVTALPGWSAALQQQQAKQRLPQQPLQLQSAAVVSSAAQLQAAVRRNPALWRDGTGELAGA